MGKKWVWVIFGLFFMWAQPSWAVLDLELTQGSKSAVPLGVEKFSGTAGSAVIDQLSQVVGKDLYHSGWFRLLSLPAGESSSVQAWRAQGANAILKGRVDARGSGRYHVSIQLLGLYHAAAGNGDSLLHVEYDVRQAGLRRLAHRISDLVFAKMTGVPGNFSTKIAYIVVHHPPRRYTTYELVVADADGFAPQVLLRSYEPIMSPTWAPDGKKLAYVAFDHHRAQIYLQTLATGSRSKLLAAPGINGAPAFSPDGQHLAVVLSKSGNPKIYDYNIATQSLRQLTRGGSIDTEPSWSPDSASLLFTSNRGGSPQIYQLILQNNRIKRLTYRGNYNARARWLPSGGGFVMMHREPHRRGFRIAYQDLSSGELTNLTTAAANESPSVAPNGQMVVYSQQLGGDGRLAQVALAGDVTLSIPAESGSVQEPAWSPFLHARVAGS